ncbi:M43 family zinc metalloprotease [Dyadobacter subterraneus]|uniref:Peptidase M43 pregnancy-associated plasma-A domain-containing protein n=1 Tax=Dyadobacter subterraneus TaxID=2773304 RepID=A0ABR9WGX3_9BACT|nr:M43 family zinc metalloprotease [Dyadobacter subterraneus]MBE9463596.1 hypothetical protein [Dyadobacter subterraneus]
MKYQFMFSARLFCLFYAFCLLSGCEKVAPLETDEFYRFDNLHKLSIQKPKTTDFFLGTEKPEIPLSAIAYDERGSVIEAPSEVISFYSNDVEITGESFVPEKVGRYAIVGKLAGQVSDTMIIRVWNPASLKLSLSISNQPAAFYANGKDTLNFKVNVLKGSKVVGVKFPYQLYVNDKEQRSGKFATKTSGVYKFQVKGLGQVSNEITINALPKPTYPVVRLPVIFHEVNTRVLTADRIRQLTADMSRAFRNQFNINQAEKDPNAEDLFVEFYPAETGLDGKKLSSPGLHQAESSKTSFSSNDAFNDAFTSFWDPRHYLNVWVYPNITGEYEKASWSYYPSVTVPMDGLLTVAEGTAPFFPYGIFLNGNHASINYEGGRTEEVLAHEAGHVLGLYHVFNGNNTSFNSCNTADPDFCRDTPFYDRNSYASNIDFDRRYQRISCAGVEYTSTNFMDYYYTNNNSFTTEQLKRVRHAINYCIWLPTPRNSAKSGRQNGRSSLVERPANLKYIKPVICEMP